MSTNTPEAQDLLRLFKCVVDTGTDVLAAFAKFKLLPSFNGNFELFLEDKKHEIFHLWQSHKLLCCACLPAGCNLKRMNRIDNWIFKKIYDDNGPENRGHIVYSMGKVVQVCLHKYLTRNIAIDDLDISVIACLLRNLANLSPNETSALDIITTTRSQVCHAYSTNCYPLTLLNATWTALENALVDLTDPSYKRIIQKQIKYLRKVELEKEEITEVLQKVEEVNGVLHEISDMQKTNNGIIKNGFTTCKNQIMKATKEINQNTDLKLAEIKEEVQQLRATINILLDQSPRRTKYTNTQNDEHKESSLYNVDELSSEEVYDQQGAKPKRKFEDIRHVCATCHVEGEELDEQSAVQSLSENKHSFPSDFGFNIITAEQKCLLLELKATSRILEDINSFRMALRALIIQIVRAGKIDINKPSTITVRLIFKDDITEDDIKVIKEISGQMFYSHWNYASLTYPSVAIPNDTRRLSIKYNCKNCDHLQTEITYQRTAIGLLELKNRDLIFSIIVLELLRVWQILEKSKLSSENKQLHGMIALHSAASERNTKTSKLQEVQNWVEESTSSIMARWKLKRKSRSLILDAPRSLSDTDTDSIHSGKSSKTSGTGSMIGSMNEVMNKRAMDKEPYQRSIEAGSRRRSGSMIERRRPRSCIF